MGEAIYQNDISKVKNLLSHGIDVNQLSKDNYGFTYLMYSVFLQDRFEITNVLLAAGADPNIVSTITFTAYHAEGISAANTPGVRNKLPLHSMAKGEPLERLQVLLEHGADPNQSLTNSGSDYPVLYEAATSNTGILDIYASDEDSLKRVELQLQYGLDIKKQTQVEKSINPLRNAYFSDHINTILFMIEQGADITASGADLVRMIKKDFARKIGSDLSNAKKRILLDKLTELGY